MRINFYDTKITKEHETMLVKEKAVNYGVEILDAPKLVEMINELLALNTKGEEHCYMLAMNTRCRIVGIFFLSKGDSKPKLCRYKRGIYEGIAYRCSTHYLTPQPPIHRL